MSATIAHRGGNEPAPPWLRQPREPAGAYAAFVVYRDQDPPRSLVRLGRALGRSKRALAEWSRTWGWVERADAYTAHLDALAVAVVEDELVRRRREEAERTYELGSALRDVAHFRVTGATDPTGQETVAAIHPNELDADDVARWADLGTKLVRLSMGLPTDLTGTITVSLPEFQRMIGEFVEIARRHMDEEAHEALVRDCYAMVAERLGG